MKKLRGLSMVMALGMAVSSTAMAEEAMLIAANPNNITVNGTVLENAEMLEHEGTKMIPLRAVCEALGFEVNWNEEARRIELVNLPSYITLTPDEDGYTFAKTAPMKLGKAPVMKENRTYVPLNFVDEILHGSYNEDGGINITWGVEEKTDNVSAVYIKEVTEEGFLIEDFYRGEVRLTIGDETVIVDEEGNPVKAEDIDTSRELLVKYADIMTMSIPPLTNAVEITVTNEVAKTVLEGEITEVIKQDDKAVQLVIGDNEFVLNIGDDLIVTDAEGNEIETEFTEGMKVRALTKGMSTMSIPPQYPVTNIIVAE